MAALHPAINALTTTIARPRRPSHPATLDMITAIRSPSRLSDSLAGETVYFGRLTTRIQVIVEFTVTGRGFVRYADAESDRLQKILHRARRISRLLEVHRQLRGDLTQSSR